MTSGYEETINLRIEMTCPCGASLKLSTFWTDEGIAFAERWQQHHEDCLPSNIVEVKPPGYYLLLAKAGKK